MRFLKPFFKFYINSSIHVALAVASLLGLTFLKSEIAIDFNLFVFVFLASITGYNFVKYAPVAKLHHRGLTQQLQIIQIFSFFCFIGLMISCFYVSFQVIYLGFVLGIINLMYAIPLYKSNLREVPLLKVFLIALIWAVVTVVFPFIYDENSRNFNEKWTFELIERFFLVVLLMVPFEIRDYPYDKKYLETIVSTLGLTNTKLFSIILIIGLFTLRLLIFDFNNILFYVLVYLSLSYVILVSKLHQKPYFASFWVEALPIFWLILAFLMFKELIY
jgi:hypothetical protein